MLFAFYRNKNRQREGQTAGAAAGALAPPSSPETPAFMETWGPSERPLNRLVVTPGLWPRAHAPERPTGVHALQAQPLVPQEGWQWAAAVSRADLGFLFSGTAGWLGGLLQAGERGVELGLCHPPAPRNLPAPLPRRLGLAQPPPGGAGRDAGWGQSPAGPLGLLGSQTGCIAPHTKNKERLFSPILVKCT